MATNFPSSADSFTNPTSGDTLDNPPHDQQHSDINDAMEAVQGALLDGAPLHVDDANERVGVGTASPEVPLHVEGGTDAALTAGSGYLQVGETTGDNIVIDGNEILARNNGSKDTLFMQNEGDYVYIGSNVTGTPSTESLRIQSGIRGQLPSTNGSNQLIHLYNNVNIGFPTGWGGQDAPQYGLSVYGAIDSGNPIISGQMGTAMTHPNGDTILLFNEFWENQGGITYSSGVFTVPIAGKYRITLNPFMHTSSGAFRVLIGINNSAPANSSHYGHCYASSGSGYDTLCLDSIVDLTANSTIRFRLYEGKIYNASSDRFNQFSIAKIA